MCGTTLAKPPKAPHSPKAPKQSGFEAGAAPARSARPWQTSLITHEALKPHAKGFEFEAAPRLRVLHDLGKAQLRVVRHVLQQQRHRHADVGGGRERVQHDRGRAVRRRLAAMRLPGRPEPRARLRLPLPRCVRRVSGLVV